MPQWYYRLKGTEEHGPIGPAELLNLIRNGVIGEETLVKKDDSKYVPSIEINGLWAAAGRPRAEFNCPYCGRGISKPPVQCPGCSEMVEHAVGHLAHVKIASHKVKSVVKKQSQTSSPVSPAKTGAGKKAGEGTRAVSESVRDRSKAKGPEGVPMVAANDKPPEKRKWFGLIRRRNSK